MRSEEMGDGKQHTYIFICHDPTTKSPRAGGTYLPCILYYKCVERWLHVVLNKYLLNKQSILKEKSANEENRGKGKFYFYKMARQLKNYDPIDQINMD